MIYAIVVDDFFILLDNRFIFQGQKIKPRSLFPGLNSWIYLILLRKSQ